MNSLTTDQCQELYYLRKIVKVSSVSCCTFKKNDDSSFYLTKTNDKCVD